MAPWVLLAASVLVAETLHSACPAARAPLGFPAGIVPAALLADVESYRGAWRTRCESAEGAPVAPLLAQATRIERAFQPLLGKLEGERGLLDRASEFLPGFAGTSQEIVFLRVDLEPFAALATKGSAEDRSFLEAYLGLRGSDPFPPWLERTVDYGGCRRLGSYDWATAFEAARKLAASARSEVYAQMARALAADLRDQLDAVSRGGPICVCETKDRALAALDAAASRLEAGGDPRVAASVKGAAGAVRTGRSQARWECTIP